MQNVKGTFDYRGEEQRLRNRIRSVLEDRFALYDFEPMETAIVNECSLLASKYAGGDEILKEMYTLSDQGGRELGLRYDLTVPFAKFVAGSAGLELPFKRYEIGKVFRDGPVKRGRLREFVQCDADIAGITGPEAEAELMQLAADVFRELGIAIVIKWNNRRFLGELLGRLGVGETWMPSVMLTLDKLEKIGAAGVEQELADKGLEPDVYGPVVRLIEAELPDFEELVTLFGLSDKEGTAEVRRLGSLLEGTGLNGICKFDPFLSRGLSFYTGTVYECFIADGSFGSSLASGGRYDAIIGKLAGKEQFNCPAVGLSFGLDSILECCRGRVLEQRMEPVWLVPIGDTMVETLRAASMLRDAGIWAKLAPSGRKLKRTLAAASAEGARYVILVGEEEAAAGQMKLKDMRAGEEMTASLPQLVCMLEKTVSKRK
ncbi:histidine--tRNA ligase [Paenibacillus oceani]|uniref:Histidine--tRNA ligase n=1 Tax=Paenibacillus oceani TaxID=2772510 RepID=A0A927CCT8_9BACL|nr:histidine--tRNA ligase [Paenibacillus oceani]MBD2865694.1 histidine--tRNA ligase [Paenibacillus oceani]